MNIIELFRENIDKIKQYINQGKSFIEALELTYEDIKNKN